MRNIIITGGGMVNKGAQAMTLIAVHELRKHFPNHKIYLYSPEDLLNTKLDKEQFDFEFTGWYPLKFAHCQNNPLQRAIILLCNRSELLQAEAIYRNTDFVVDVSGYALGANWSDKICNDFLDNLEFARGFDIPVYLLPQSFGPFDFDAKRQTLNDRIRKLLPSAKVIFAREQEGYDALVNTYGLTNVRLATDLVLCNKGIDLESVFKRSPVIKLPRIAANSVAVIPNSMNISVSSRETVLTIYSDIVNKLLNLGKTVYLLSHSSVDVTLCCELKEQFEKNENVILLEQDFSCLEFNELVQGFCYLVASRFHSIVHAYKNGVPCVALGWATKYHDLLKLFGQENYVFDIRCQERMPELLSAIEQMDYSHTEEAEKICRVLADVQNNNVFEILSQEQKELK